MSVDEAFCADPVGHDRRASRLVSASRVVDRKGVFNMVRIPLVGKAGFCFLAGRT